MTETPKDIKNPDMDPLEDKNKPDWWFKWIRSARDSKYPKRHRRDSRDAWRCVEKDNSNGDDVNTNQDDSGDVYPIYWASSEILGPSLYAKPPEVITTREFEINDDVANTMALISDRLGKYHVRNSNFHTVMEKARNNLMHAAKATNQVIYECKLLDVNKRQVVVPGAEGQFTNQDGSIHDGEVLQDQQGYFYESDEKNVDEDSQKIYMSPVSYDEILHTPNAKTFHDITDMAYYFTFTKEECEGKFDDEVLANYPWKTGSSRGNEDSDKKQDNDAPDAADKYLDGYECYCKYTKTVYWVSESYKRGFLKSPEKDPYGFRNFFPSPPFILQNTPEKHLYPRPTYIQLRPTITQLNVLYNRIFRLIDSVRRRAIVDGDDDLISALNAGEQEFITARSTKGIVEKGGLEAMLFYLPVGELATALNEAMQTQTQLNELFNTWFGTPEIMQGEADPGNSEGTNQIMSSSANNRFKSTKRSIQELARDSIEMMVDLSFKVFSDEKIARIVGLQYMSPEEQQTFPMALQALRNDEERFIRVDIETDSLIFVDENIVAQRRNQAIQTAMSGMDTIASLYEKNPAMGRIALKAILLQLENNSEGKQFQSEIKALGKELEDAAAQPPPPPQPDPMVAIQQQLVGIKQQEVGIKQAQFQFDTQFKPQELQQKGAIAAGDQQIKAQDVQIKGVAVQSNAQQAATKNQLDMSEAELQQQLDSETLKLEQFNSIHDAKVKELQEARLDKEQILETMHTIQEHLLARKALEVEDKHAITTHAVDHLHTMTDLAQADSHHEDTIKANEKIATAKAATPTASPPKPRKPSSTTKR